MKRTTNFAHMTQLALLVLVVALAVAGAASAAVGGGLPGKLCGSVGGAPWNFQGQHGTRYNVSALPAGACATALKAVGRLTRQTPRAGALGGNTLSGPTGFRCAGSGIKASNAGFCGGRAAKFLWAPRLAK
jgi:hypothetical protein